MLYTRILTFVSMIFCVQTILAQSFNVAGKVSDQSTGEPIAGAKVYIPQTGKGALVDANGNFTISNLPPNTYTIVASFIGYKPQEKEFVINNAPVKLNFELTTESYALNEIVVTGTGTEHYLKDAPVQTEEIGRASCRERV